MRRAGLISVVFVVLCAGPSASAQRPAEALSQFLRHPRLKDAGVGILVADLETGRVVVEHGGGTPRVPASNMKILTAVSALEFLGADHAFTTRLRVKGTVTDGVLTGDLVLEGDGDALFGTEPAKAGPEAWARKVREAGIREVRGNVVVCERGLDGNYLHDDWRAYNVADRWVPNVAALTSGDNLVRIRLHPAAAGKTARLSVRPPCGHVTLVNKTRLSAKRSRAPWFERQPGSNRVVVHGNPGRKGKPLEGSVAVHDPPLFLGRVFRWALGQAGVSVTGKVVRSKASFDGVRVLVDHVTPLTRMIESSLKTSDNRVTETLFKAAGGRFTKKPGSFAAGADAVRELLRRAGVDATLGAVRDGSGLSRNNRITVAQLCAVLRWAYKRPYRTLFSQALPSGGEPGSTLRKRFRGSALAPALRAKTGYLRDARSLSGYLRVGRRRALVFSVLLDGLRSNDVRTRRALDAFIAAVWKSEAEKRSRTDR